MLAAETINVDSSYMFIVEVPVVLQVAPCERAFDVLFALPSAFMANRACDASASIFQYVKSDSLYRHVVDEFADQLFRRIRITHL